ncbi:jg2956, partial [Pararge aegeria aegeria]
MLGFIPVVDIRSPFTGDPLQRSIARRPQRSIASKLPSIYVLLTFLAQG